MQSSEFVVPDLLVLDTRRAIANFTSMITVPARDLHELIRQLFDDIDERGLNSSSPVNPILSMLVCVQEPVTWTPRQMYLAFNRLCFEMKQILISMNFSSLIAIDHGTFNYTFDSLRDGCLVLKHLNPLEDR